MKRFYRTAAVGDAEGGHLILLDGRPVRTPGRRLLAIPSPELARAVADEWAAQGETIRPQAMPLARLTNTVVDQLPERRSDAIDEIMGYASADLLCYRHDSPRELGERQAGAWQPWLDWAAVQLDARLVTTVTLEPVPQPQSALDALAKSAAALDDWRLVGLHAAVRLMGSIILGFAMVEGALAAEEAFAATMLEELYEIEAWGLEAEQARRHAALKVELAAVATYLAAVRA